MEKSPFDKGDSLLLKENNKRIRYLTEEEILSLKWKQVKNGFIYLKETKTDEPREVPINDEMAQLFKEIRKEQEMESEYVFTIATTRIRLLI